MCAKFSDVFHLPNDKLTTTNVYKQKIHLKPHTSPVFKKPYRIPHSQKQELNNQINKLLHDGIIEPTQSEWSSPVLLVPKKSKEGEGKKWRLVIDYRQLNNHIQDDKFPLPNITEILDSLSGSIYFSHLDLFSGYYQVLLDEESRKYTAFCSGTYQLTRLPQGLKVSPGSFSRMITVAMSGLNYEKCFVYLDDLIVFGRNLADHNKNLMDVFYRLRKVNLKLNPEKCDFLKKEILYLGHVVSEKGILPDPDKLKVLNEYPVPKNIDEVKRFVAFANYYRKFIPNFAEKAHPLNKLSRKNVDFTWNEQCQKSFETLKESLITPPVLAYPDLSERNHFIIQTDASGYSIGAILANNDGRPTAYTSRGLNKAELNYPTIQKELLAIVWAIKYFRPYLYGRRFTIQTDHRPLIYLFNLRDPSSRLLKFRLELEEYDFTVEYVKGKDNAAADALSRIKITSEELKEMHRSVINVMTRSMYKQIAKQNSSSSSIDLSSNNVRSDQPKVIELSKRPSNSVELLFSTSQELSKKGLQDEVKHKSKTLCYMPSKMIIYINSNAQSQISRAEFVRELETFCKTCQVDEICIVKCKDNYVFVDKLAKEISKTKDWTGPPLCIIKDIIRITEKDDKRVILIDFHLLPTSGHAGARRMINNIKKYYFWSGLERDVKTFVERCTTCKKQKYTCHTKEPMVITTTANSAFDKIYLDLVGPLDKDSYSYSYILTLQCELSKYVEAYPLVSKTTAEVAKALVNNFILRYDP
jgi:lipoate-protein ligase A